MWVDWFQAATQTAAWTTAGASLEDLTLGVLLYAAFVHAFHVGSFKGWFNKQHCDIFLT